MSIATYAIPRTEDDAQVVASRLEIARLLRSVEEKKSLMKIYVQQRAVAVSATILDVDLENNAIILDDSSESEFKHFHENEDVSYEITLESTRILFSSQEVEPCEHDKRPALRLSLPKSVTRIQRRESYRLDVPVTDPATCRIILPGGAGAISLQVKDISTGGVSLVDNQQQLGSSAGTLYTSCQLDLPGTGTLPVKLQVMRFMNEALPFEQESRHVGCKFVDLHNSTEIQVQNYISSLERAINAKRRGFD
ncbi:MAG TPA: flagellar regulator YcgR PilZN domain-containing protein [Burkholderiaceae bacterium]|nr:flagellar regulator YcgR PilZN domain-containing protein [Burkholderiaceae bacterium]